jgi:S-DNA-T family DNA segregation ATPase FtsK/SpoIIIE
MNRSNLWRWVGICGGVGAWAFMLLSIGSFSPVDWPSHAVYPYPPIGNLCGPAGAFVAYWMFLIVGQGAFPLLLFTGIALVFHVAHYHINDLWMRGLGLLLMVVAFAAAVHHIHPGSANGFPEGQGGILGIGASSYLQSHFGTAGTRLWLMVSLLIGLLLAADDLVLAAPAAIGHLLGVLRLPAMPRLALPALGRSGANASGPIQRMVKPDEEPEDMKMPVLLRLKQFARGRNGNAEDVDLTYDNDEPSPAAAESALADGSDPGPAAHAAAPDPLPQPSTDEIESGSAALPAPPPGVPPPQRADIVVKLPNMLKPRQVSPPAPPPKELGEYHLPPWDCLEDAEHGYAESQEAFVREMAAVLEQALKEFSVDAHVVEIDTGPVITMYELALAPGLKVSTITSLTNDIMRALKAESVRIVAPVPGKNTVGIEVPNAQKEKVRFKELMSLAPDAMSKMVMPLFLGKDASGEPLITDLAAMPHCLIAGTTGSGKSVCINTIIMSIMYLQRPDWVKLILIDPKVVEMAPFKDIPHLMCPVINDTGRATSVLEWACEKMDERYEYLAEAGVRNIKGYNSLTREDLVERFKPGSEEEEAKIPKHLPYIVIIIDELADLMMTSGKEVESFIVRLAQKSRAVGIHLILATQRPAATVVTGLIKSNMPTRISFRVQSRMDSRIVMDQNGAELLLGQGDMLFMPPGASKPIRSQGTFIDDKEIRDSVKLVKSLADAQYEPELVQIKGAVNMNGEMEKDELFDDAVRVVLETKRGSVSLLQRRLTIGYARASRLIEMMAQTGIVGDYKGSQAREAMLTLEEWDAMKAQQQADADSGMTV